MTDAVSPSKDDENGEATSGVDAQPAHVSFADFLEGSPPSQQVEIGDLLRSKNAGYVINRPELHLHCSSEICNGLRIFRSIGDDQFAPFDGRNLFLSYICSNCRQRTKFYALHAKMTAAPSGTAYKFGEQPPFGPPTPPRLLRLFGKDRDIFLKGRRCESQGLGIGAFGYYRRVVESHRDQIFDEIIKVAQKISAPPAMIATLVTAKSETQFSKALEAVKDAVPQALLMNGHNPLTLLHSALSNGLHQQTDEKCLELAQDIRVVLAELADRLGQLMKDEAELSAAVSRLMRPPPNSTA